MAKGKRTDALVQYADVAPTLVESVVPKLVPLHVLTAVLRNLLMERMPIADLPRIMKEAFHVASTGRPGPVLIDLPKDVQNWVGEFRGEGLLPVPGYRQRLHAARDNLLDDDKLARFFGMLEASRRPLIYAGGGVINGDAADELRRFADHFGIPVTTTLMGIGAVDTRQPLSLHMLGMHGLASANYAVEDCDFLIAVGARFDDRVAGVPDKFAPKTRHIAQFDIDPSEIGKVKAIDWFHVGVLKQDLKAVHDYGVRHHIAPDFSAWHREIADLKSTYALNFDRDSEMIQPYAVVETINAITQGDANAAPAGAHVTGGLFDFDAALIAVGMGGRVLHGNLP